MLDTSISLFFSYSKTINSGNIRNILFDIFWKNRHWAPPILHVYFLSLDLFWHFHAIWTSSWTFHCHVPLDVIDHVSHAYEVSFHSTFVFINVEFSRNDSINEAAENNNEFIACPECNNLYTLLGSIRHGIMGTRVMLIFLGIE